MAQGHLSNEEFFTKLASLIQTTQQAGHGAVHLSQKRRTTPFYVISPLTPPLTKSQVTFDQNSEPTTPSKIQDDPLWDLHPPHPLPLLVRATDGKGKNKDNKQKKTKTKLSTVVQPEGIEGFFARYAEVCKAGMQSLKKRDRSKRKKEKNKKKKGGEEKKA